MPLTKHPKYQDYVIKDGKLIGEFEQMYRDFPDPWEQINREQNRTEKAIAIHLLKKVKANRVIELGCGLGHYTHELATNGFDVLGIDIAPTAIKKATASFPDCKFQTGDILDFEIYEKNKPDAIVMSEITWYVLEKLDRLLDYLKQKPSLYLVHLLNTYPAGTQKLGADKFTNLDEIRAYFAMNILEYGEANYADLPGDKRTYFIGRYGPL